MKQERQREQEPDVVDAAEMSVDESGEEIEIDEGCNDSGSQASNSANIQAEDVSKTLRSF